MSHSEPVWAVTLFSQMNILGIGIATLDIINTVDGYPAEDSEVRAVRQQQRRGGNVTNTLAVLSQQGHCCSWAGVLANEPDTQYIIDDLKCHNIDYRYCRHITGGKAPASYITLNQRNGSRTIVHYRNLPEFDFPNFNMIDLAPYDWVHFEGRNIEETRKMLEKCAAKNLSLPRSLEVEKVRPGIETLFRLANVLLFSKDYAARQGFDNGTDFLHFIRKQAPHAILVCAWGTQGASAMDANGSVFASRAYPPAKVIDTTGAGDVFNAGIIDGLLRNQKLEQTLSAACRLAGHKCGIPGINGLLRSYPGPVAF